MPVVNNSLPRDIEYMCQNSTDGLMYPCQSCSFCWYIVPHWAQHRSTSRWVGYWNMVQVFMGQVQLSLQGISVPIIHVQAQLRCAIMSRMRFLDVYVVNIYKVRLIMGVSFQCGNASRAWNKTPKCLVCSSPCTLHVSVLHCHHVYFDFETADAVHSDCHGSRHFRCGCWLLILLLLCYPYESRLHRYVKATAELPSISHSVSMVRCRTVTLQNSTINAQTRPNNNLTELNIDYVVCLDLCFKILK